MRLARSIALWPALWLVLFVALPLGIVLKISLAESQLAMPPYSPLLKWEEGWPRLDIRFDNYSLVFEDSLYLRSLFTSLRVAALGTALTLLLGLPMAYGLARADARWRPLLLTLVILPFWTSFLIRIYAWIGILKDEGLLNHALMAIGLIDAPLVILNTEWAVQIGIVYAYLPFMVLPIYATLVKLDPVLLEAAADLGCPPAHAFWHITVPLALPGIIAGCLLVFVPALGEVVIPDLLGGINIPMLGRTLWTEFFNNRDWPLASAIAMVLLLLIAGPIVLLERVQARRRELRV
jgi:putrescine transport system permease protein